MVLVSYILDNYISILQTKFGDREGHEARRIGLETMPLDQHIRHYREQFSAIEIELVRATKAVFPIMSIEGGHGERQARLKIRPAPMHAFFEMADERQHREHRLHEHTILPLAPRTQFEIRGIALGSME